MAEAYLDDDGDRFALRLSLRAFFAAASRYVDNRNQEDPGLAFAAIGEALFWAGSIDEGLRLLSPSYPQQRDASDEGRILNGIPYARNRVTHQRANVLVASLVWMSVHGARGGPVGTAFRWRSAAQLPRGRSAFGREVYEQEMQGLDVFDAIERLSGWFAGPEVEVLVQP